MLHIKEKKIVNYCCSNDVYRHLWYKSTLKEDNCGAECGANDDDNVAWAIITVT